MKVLARMFGWTQEAPGADWLPFTQYFCPVLHCSCQWLGIGKSFRSNVQVEEYSGVSQGQPKDRSGDLVQNGCGEINVPGKITWAHQTSLVFISCREKSACRVPEFTFRGGRWMEAQDRTALLVSVLPPTSVHKVMWLEKEKGSWLQFSLRCLSTVFIWIVTGDLPWAFKKTIFSGICNSIWHDSLDAALTADLGLTHTVVPPSSIDSGPRHFKLSWCQLWRSAWSQDSDDAEVRTEIEDGKWNVSYLWEMYCHNDDRDTTIL